MKSLTPGPVLPRHLALLRCSSREESDEEPGCGLCGCGRGSGSRGWAGRAAALGGHRPHRLGPPGPPPHATTASARSALTCCSRTRLRRAPRVGQGAGGRRDKAWRAAGRRVRSAGSLCAGEWAPRVGGPGACANPDALSPKAASGVERSRGPGSKFLLQVRLRGQIYREALDCLFTTIPRPCASFLQLSREIGAGTQDTVPDVRLWRDPGPPATGSAAGLPLLSLPPTLLY